MTHGTITVMTSGLSHEYAGATSLSDLGVSFDDSSVGRGAILILQHLKLQPNIR